MKVIDYFNQNIDKLANALITCENDDEKCYYWVEFDTYYEFNSFEKALKFTEDFLLRELDNELEENLDLNLYFKT